MYGVHDRRERQRCRCTSRAGNTGRSACLNAARSHVHEHRSCMDMAGKLFTFTFYSYRMSSTGQCVTRGRANTPGHPPEPTIRANLYTMEEEDHCRKQFGATATTPNHTTTNPHRSSSNPTHSQTKSNIAPDPGGHRPQRPYAQGPNRSQIKPVNTQIRAASHCCSIVFSYVGLL